MARYECFSRSQQIEVDLLPLAREALESQGFKVRSALGESLSMIDTQPVRRLRERTVVILDQNRTHSGNAELQCVITNEAISSGPDCRCRNAFEHLLGCLHNAPYVEVETAAA